MDGQRQSSSRRRKSKRSRAENKPNGHNQGQVREEPVLIAARRPNAPAARPKRRFIAASATPRHDHRTDAFRTKLGLPGEPPTESDPQPTDHVAGEASSPVAHHTRERPLSRSNGRHSAATEEPGKPRAARIVQVQSTGLDDREKLRLKLIDRLLHSEGRVAITRAAREISEAGFEFPVVQDVQLQLLEHFDEGCAHQAICHLAELLNDEAPIKRPLFEQRLRRLEEFADDADTRQAAAELRRTVRA